MSNAISSNSTKIQFIDGATNYCVVDLTVPNGAYFRVPNMDEQFMVAHNEYTVTCIRTILNPGADPIIQVFIERN